MKNALLLSLSVLLISSCASVKSVQNNPACVVWRDQKYWGPFSIEVVENKVFWNAKCKGYNSGCTELELKLDENKNVLSGDNVLGKIENNELKFAEKHALTNAINYTAIRAYPEQKLVKSSVTANTTVEESYQYNDKCSPEEAILGAVSLTVITHLQTTEKK